ncbi:hypothetical protein NSQ59_24315 [Margalitia sp. FSL K6-0131]|uniref:hypothetical protein n=1 Tax=Margalitia sp. FSL K6-0131 TaxID=2954604 RepID=UPI0030FBE2D1
MRETSNLKLNVYLLLAIIPLSALGYYFAVQKEELFFLYEWLLAALVIVSVLLSIKNIVSIKNEKKWIAVSILAFLLQFSVLGLFLEPLTHYWVIYLYYVVAVLSVAIFIITMGKSKRLKMVPIVFTILTALFTFYMLFLNAMWGNGF